MVDRADVHYDIYSLGVAGVYSSTVDALTAGPAVLRGHRPLTPDHLYRFDGDEVLLATRHGRVHIGRLRVTERGIELWQILANVPCRRRVPRADIVSCCPRAADDDFWEAPTRPDCPELSKVVDAILDDCPSS
ncbi:hypothetical protein [Haliangium sp.]|uniref:hypothetical protein n=1 Tax=Haliangium sp. TaxID=2663208 RepID=UPI003D1356F0